MKFHISSNGVVWYKYGVYLLIFQLKLRRPTSKSPPMHIFQWMCTTDWAPEKVEIMCRKFSLLSTSFSFLQVLLVVVAPSLASKVCSDVSLLAIICLFSLSGSCFLNWLKKRWSLPYYLGLASSLFSFCFLFFLKYGLWKKNKINGKSEANNSNKAFLSEL